MMLGTSIVALRCTFSKLSMSFARCGLHAWHCLHTELKVWSDVRSVQCYKGLSIHMFKRSAHHTEILHGLLHAFIGSLLEIWDDGHNYLHPQTVH